MRTSDASQQHDLFGQLPSSSGRQARLIVTALVLQSFASLALVRYAPIEFKSFVRSNETALLITLAQEETPERQPKAVPAPRPIKLPRLRAATPIPVRGTVEEKISIPRQPLANQAVRPLAQAIEKAPAQAPIEQPKVVTAKKVQTGGFGDENGPPPLPIGKGPSASAVVGLFEAPLGPGFGNGTRGLRGQRGFLPGAGFGGGVAERPTMGGAPGRGTSNSGFDEAAAAPAKPPAQRPSGEFEPPLVTYKPTPAYTDEARALRIQGDVVLEVIFQASGKIRVLRVVRGLGHGLDESAKRAAEGMQFTPAREAGTPADYRAVVHITFQLA